MIRPARLDDIPAIRSLLEPIRVPGIAYDDFTPPVLVYVDLMGDVVGVMQALVGSPYTVITECAIRADYQNRGVGKRLLEHMETLLMTMGVKGWVAFTGTKNPCRDLLERVATPTGTGEGFVKVFA